MTDIPISSRFSPAGASDAEGCVAVRPWNVPERLRTLVTDARPVSNDGFVGVIGGNTLARGWLPWGAPAMVGGGFHFVLRDSHRGAILTAGIDADVDPPAFMFAIKGPDEGAIDALEQELNTLPPVQCSLEVPGDGYDFTIGYRKGRAFLKLRVDS